MKRVLVTGGLGFIGSHNVGGLITSGYDVTVLDNMERQVLLRKIPDYRNKNANYIIGDIRYKKHWLKVLKDVSYIIHIASSVGTATLNEILYRNENLRKNIKKVVIDSSKSIYGKDAHNCGLHGVVFPVSKRPEDLKKQRGDLLGPKCTLPMKPTPLSENKPDQNQNPYVLGKYITENLSMQFAKVISIPTVAFRYLNACGTRGSMSNPYIGVLAVFLARLKKGDPPTLYEGEKLMCDYINVEGMANASSLRRGDGVYNLGIGQNTSLLEPVSKLNELLSIRINPVIQGKFQICHNRHNFEDNRRPKSHFDIRNFPQIEQGIRKLYDSSSSTDIQDPFARIESQMNKFLMVK